MRLYRARKGQDNDGLSVNVVCANTLEMLRRRLGAPKKEAVTLHVGRVCEISAGVHRLNVKADPVEGDDYHALITGFPPRGLDETSEMKAIWNRLAELLAQQARCCLKA